MQKPCPQEDCGKEAGNCGETAAQLCGCDVPRDDAGTCRRPPAPDEMPCEPRRKPQYESPPCEPRKPCEPCRPQEPQEPPCGCPPRENPCPPTGIFSKISAEDLLLFGAALFLLFSKESDNIIIPVLLVLVIML